MNKKIIIIGIGETANLAYEYFTYDSDWEVEAFAVDKDYIKQDTFRDLPVVPIEEMIINYSPQEYSVFVAFGSGELNYQRTNMYHRIKELGYKFASYVSSKAFVWRNVEIGENCFILEDNTLQPFTKIGNNVVMWSGNHVGHQSKICDNCFITSHVVISGFCEVGKNTFIGVNSSVADGVKIAKDNFITMGAVINKNTVENSIYKGNPAIVAPISAKKFCRVKE